MDDFTCHICAARVAIKSAEMHYAWHRKIANEIQADTKPKPGQCPNKLLETWAADGSLHPRQCVLGAGHRGFHYYRTGNSVLEWNN